jgi:predicted oxidoreductase
MQIDQVQAMAWSPLAGGQIFGSDAAAQRVRPLLEKLTDGRVDVAAFAWLLAHPAGILPVVGTNNIDRIKGLAEAMDITIDRETWFEIWTAAAGQEVP